MGRFATAPARSLPLEGKAKKGKEETKIMINFKKLLAGTLSAAMVLGTMTIPAFADESVSGKAAKIGETEYATLQDAFDNAKKDDTITLLKDIELTDTVEIATGSEALSGITLAGNGKTVSYNFGMSKSAFFFDKYPNGINIKDLTMTGSAKYGIYFTGGGSSNLTNVNISGSYFYTVALYGTHGGTFTNCNITNDNDGKVSLSPYLDSAIWTNVAYTTPVNLINSKISSININGYVESRNTFAPKIYVDKDSETKIYSFTNGYSENSNVVPNKLYCLDPKSTGKVTVQEFINDAPTNISDPITPVAKANVTVTVNNSTETFETEILFDSLAGAVAAVKDGGTVTLLDDVTVSELISFPNNTTLDLNGKTLKSDFNKGYAFVFKNGGSIVDTAETKGSIESTNARTINSESTNAMFTVDGVTAVNTSGNADAVVIATNGGGLTLKNSTITSVNGTGYALSSFSTTATDSITDVYTIENTNVTSSYTCLYRNGNAGKFQMNAKDSSLICDKSQSSYNDTSVAAYISNHSRNDKWKHQVTFENCTITGDTGIEAKYTDLTLKNCDITAKGTLSYIQNNNGSTSDGFSVVITDNAKGTVKALPEGTVKIDGGNYIGLIGLENLASAKDNHMNPGTKTDVQISGGTFPGQDVTEYTADGYYYDATDKTVKKSAAKVIDNAKSAGVKVTLDNLEKNSAIDKTADATYNVVLDTVKPEDKAAVDEIKNANPNKTVIAYDIYVEKTENGIKSEVKDVTNQKVTLKLPTKVKEGGEVKVYHNGIEINDVAISEDRMSVSFIAPSFSAYTFVYDADALTDSDITKNIKVEFEQVTDSEYDIVLKATNSGKKINGLLTADLTFSLTQGTTGLVNYEITPAANMSLLVNGNRYTFSFDGTNAHSATGDEIVIGKVVFDGYCTGAKFNIVDTATTNLVNTTKAVDSIVESYIANGDGINTGILDTTASIDGINLTQETANLTINVSFPNAVVNQAAAYQDMKVTVSGNGANEVVKLGSDNSNVTFANDTYTVEFTDKLVKGNTYTVTVEGAGYRTARYTVSMTGAKTLNFWNNVKTAPAYVEENVGNPTNTNFLAGDIVKDGQINIYDLSAVVSYFGTDNLVSEHPTYAKYDLNRDGVIDSKDVAYVLVSWGK